MQDKQVELRDKVVDVRAMLVGRILGLRFIQLRWQQRNALVVSTMENFGEYICFQSAIVTLLPKPRQS